MSQADQSQETARLVQKACAGCMTAFEELVSLFEGRVYSFAFMLCRDREDAREITQDTFIRAYRALAQFDVQKPFAPWLFAIARRRFIDLCRGRHRDIPPGMVAGSAEHDLNTPFESLVCREDSQELWRRARELLPDTQFQALWLRYAEDLRVDEIASVLGRTRTHVKVLLFRARNALAGELDPTNLSVRPRKATRYAAGLVSTAEDIP